MNNTPKPGPNLEIVIEGHNFTYDDEVKDWDSIVGIDISVNLLRSVSRSVLEPEEVRGYGVDTLMRKERTSILLLGGTGMGKSSLVSALVGELRKALPNKFNAYKVDVSGLLVRYGEESPAIINAFFEVLEEREDGGYSLIHLEGLHDTLQFYPAMGAISERLNRHKYDDRTIVLGESKLPKNQHPDPLLKAFKIHHTIPSLDYAARYKILEFYITQAREKANRRASDPFGEGLDLSEVAHGSEGLSGHNLKVVVDRAIDNVIGSSVINQTARKIKTDDLLIALAYVRQSEGYRKQQRMGF
ncbi:AAA family ATPase [Candidatus Woesearchaeota archaeon]|nr:AAA family ATPase [Candidatus Woesearchaeota archaeon]